MLFIVTKKMRYFCILSALMLILLICGISLYDKSEIVRLMSKVSVSSVDSPVEISQREAIKIHKNTIRKLKNFYSKYELPFLVSNVYNNDVDISELSMNMIKIKDMKLEDRNILFTKYDFMPDSTVKSAIVIKLTQNDSEPKTMALDYINAVTGQKIDVEKINDLVVDNPKDNLPTSNEISFVKGGYLIRFLYNNTGLLKIFINSTYSIIS